MKLTYGAMIVSLTAFAGLAASCGSSDSGSSSESGGLKVAAAFYPIEEIVRAVGGEDVEVVELTPPGGEPHDLELTAQTTTGLQQSAVVFYLGRGFQPGVEKAIQSLPSAVRKVDLLQGLELLAVTPQLAGTEGEVEGEALEGDADPHVWVDPDKMISLTTVVAKVLGEADPAKAKAFESRAAAYIAELADLDAEFSAQLASCESRVIVTSHRAFEYLAQRYDLQQIPIAGISPDEEPDPKSMQAVAAAAKELGVTVVFFEERVPKDLSETIASEIGATTGALDPVETITSEELAQGATYISVQQENLKALITALRCTP